MAKLKWAIIGSGIAAGAVLIPLIPIMKKRAMRVTTLLKKDHRLVSGLIATLEMTPRSNRAIREKLFEQIRTSVMVHAQAEEEVLYPAIRTLIASDGESPVDAYREHQEVKDLLSDLRTMDISTDPFDSKFAIFKSKLDHHVEEEENEMFPKLIRHTSEEQQEDLGFRIHERKVRLKPRIAA